MFPPAMSSHFLLQHVQIFLAKNARRQPTGMTEKGTNFRRHWDTSFNLCKEPTEAKMVFTPQFYITDVQYTSSNMHLGGQPYFSTSHHQCCLQCHSSTLHSWWFRFKTDLAEVYLEVPCFPGPLQKLTVVSDKSQGQYRCRSKSSGSWERGKGKAKIETAF